MPLDENVHRAEFHFFFFPPVRDPIDLAAVQGAVHCAY